MGMLARIVVVLSLLFLALFALVRIQVQPEASPVSFSSDASSIRLQGHVNGLAIDANISFSGSAVSGGIYKHISGNVSYACYFMPEMGEWVAEGGSECKPAIPLPLDRQDFEDYVRSGSYAPASRCPAGMICYSFT